MQILLSCAKIMVAAHNAALPTTIPVFQNEAESIAMQLAGYTPEELSIMLGVNRKISVQNFNRFQNFFDASTLSPSVFAYDGMVFRKLAPEKMSADDLTFANKHLNICSFLYGLLRPLDAVNPYRLEGNVELPLLHGSTLFEYWKPLLTDYLIEKTKSDDGILLNLASNEMRQMFHWKRLETELHIVSPEFKVEKNGRPRSIVIYAKMCRGAMAREVITRRLSSPTQLERFAYDGFALSGNITSTPLFLCREP